MGQWALSSIQAMSSTGGKLKISHQLSFENSTRLNFQKRARDYRCRFCFLGNDESRFAPSTFGGRNRCCFWTNSALSATAARRDECLKRRSALCAAELCSLQTWVRRRRLCLKRRGPFCLTQALFCSFRISWDDSETACVGMDRATTLVSREQGETIGDLSKKTLLFVSRPVF